MCSVLMASCEKEIPFNAEDDVNKLVVNSFLGPNLNQVVVHVSASQSLLNTNEIQFLPNAVVKLYKDNALLGNMISDGGGKFIFTHTPEIGASYRIEASHFGFESVRAETFIPTVPQINSISTPSFDNEEYLFNVNLHDNGNQENWYQLLLIQTDEFGTSPFILSFKCNSPLLPQSNSTIGDNENYYSNDAFFTDNAFNGGNASLPIRAYIGSPYTDIQFLNCSEEYYLYKKTLIQYYNVNDNPFSQPVQIYSNVEGGLGIVAGYAFDQESIAF